MWDDNDVEDKIDQVSLRYTYRDDREEVRVNREFKNPEYYPVILQQMVYFLQQMGFNYISGLVALDDKGNEMYSSEDA